MEPEAAVSGQARQQSGRITIVNLHSFANAGDAALARLAIEQIRSAFPGFELILLINHPESYAGPDKALASMAWWSKTSNGKPSKRWNPLLIMWLLSMFAINSRRNQSNTKRRWGLNQCQAELLDAYTGSDMIICIPGNSLYHSGHTGLAFFLAIFSLAFGVWLKKPVYVMPQSVGPLDLNWEKQLCRWVFRQVDLIQVREPVSLEFLLALHVPGERIQLIPDTGFLLQPTPPQEAASIFQNSGTLLNQGTPLLGVSVINWQAQYRSFQKQEIYEQAVSEVISRHIESTGGNVILVPQVTGPSNAEDDRIPSRKIYESLPEQVKSRVLCLTRQLDPAVLKSLYGLCDAFIGTRMHACIFALGMGIPVLGIGYLHKTRGLFRMMDLEEWMLDINEVTPRILLDRYNKLFVQKVEIRGKVSTMLPKIISEAQTSAEKIAVNYHYKATPK